MLQGHCAPIERRKELENLFLSAAVVLPWHKLIDQRSLHLYLIFIVNNFEALREIAKRESSFSETVSLQTADKTEEKKETDDQNFWRGFKNFGMRCAADTLPEVKSQDRGPITSELKLPPLQTLELCKQLGQQMIRNQMIRDRKRPMEEEQEEEQEFVVKRKRRRLRL